MDEENKRTKSELPTIEEHAHRAKTPDWAFAGLRARMRWPAEFRISEREYARALEAFLSGPTAVVDG